MKRFFLATFLGLCSFGLSGCQILLDTYVYFYGFSEDRTFTNLAGLNSSAFDHVKESNSSGGLYFEGGELEIELPEAALWRHGVSSEALREFRTSRSVYYVETPPNAASATVGSTYVLRIDCSDVMTPNQTFTPDETQGNFYYHEVSCPDAPGIFLGIRIKKPESWGGEIHYQLSVLVKDHSGRKVEIGSSSPAPRSDWVTTYAR